MVSKQFVDCRVNTKNEIFQNIPDVQKLKIDENSVAKTHNDAVDIIDSSQLKNECEKNEIGLKMNKTKERSFSPLFDFENDDADEGEDDGGNLEAEMLKLLEEIKNSDSNAAEEEEKDCDDDADTMVDLTFNEEKLLRNIMDRVSVHPFNLNSVLTSFPLLLRIPILLSSDRRESHL